MEWHPGAEAHEETEDTPFSAGPFFLGFLAVLRLRSFGGQPPSAPRQLPTEGIVESIKLVEDDLAADIFKVLPDLPWVRRRKKARMRHGREMMMHVVQRAKERAGDASVLRALDALNLTEEEMGDEVLLLLLAGHHTTGTAAAWLLHHLASDPEAAEAIAEEAIAVSDSAGELVPDRLPHASASLAFVREVLRLYPSAWWLSREVQRPLDLGGRKLKPGTSLLISPWHMHRDPRFWDAPTEFRRDRGFNGPAYLPFGAGPRACVGMGVGMLELQILALEFAAAYELRPMDAKVGGPKPSITLVPPPLRLSLRPRECGVKSKAHLAMTVVQ